MIKKIGNYKHIIWDWNGTLINDVWLAVEAMNKMLSKLNLPRNRLRNLRLSLSMDITNVLISVS
jgi:phosphoglycolate phosphatase-like HAD superfamily hydrolase